MARPAPSDQRLIKKAFEARAIVVGDVVLVCRLTLERRRRLCRHYGLRYAAVDLAVRPDGQWVFLELNPNGLWAWLEQVGGVPIGAALAAELAGDACG